MLELIWFYCTIFGKEFVLEDAKLVLTLLRSISVAYFEQL
jgi:hypothetical protein